MRVRATELAANLRAAVELFVLPAAIALLPWRLGHRVVRWFARAPWLYRDAVAATVAAARTAGWCDNDKAFAREQRALRLADHVDLYLSRWRSDRYLARHVECVGSWPAGDAPVLAITFHWGAGLWGIRSLAATGRRIACLSTPFGADHVGGISFALRYGYARLAEVERVSAARLIYAGHNARPFYRAIESGTSLLALIDVPPEDVGGAHAVRLLDRDAHLPSGLLKLAQRTRVPVVFFAVELDAATGRRRVHISEAFVVEDREAAMQRAAAELDRAIRRSPAAWMFWPFAPAFFANGSAAPLPRVAPTDAPL